MASSRPLGLLGLLHLLIFATTAAAEIILPSNYIGIEHFCGKELTATIAEFGYAAYREAQNSRAQRKFLPQLINERWIVVGTDIGGDLFGRFCVIFKGDIFQAQSNNDLQADVLITFVFSPLFAFTDISRRSIRVEKIEYHHV
ncbi:hypothetical protein AXF42_Ash019061 [Apostasia shenzhenica]|uniref:Uncharacterized protein n=1 Tax=Apostasia shenzhenica TaxID=1088818 RepID=A0A2I0BBA6_9ASPA|nr:hypothetical protein AXF42_Ash019061 [Apostasia shenzhenica]